MLRAHEQNGDRYRDFLRSRHALEKNRLTAVTTPYKANFGFHVLMHFMQTRIHSALFLRPFNNAIVKFALRA